MGDWFGGIRLNVDVNVKQELYAPPLGWGPGDGRRHHFSTEPVYKELACLVIAERNAGPRK